MTCAVASPGRMLTDSRETGAIKLQRQKVFTTSHGYLVGCAGMVGTWQVLEHCVKWPSRPTVKALVRFMRKYHVPDNPLLDFEAVELLIVTSRKVFELSGMAVSEVKAGAIGSGSAWAQGYLRAKPDDLRGAVEAACYYDPYCAGPVQEYQL